MAASLLSLQAINTERRGGVETASTEGFENMAKKGSTAGKRAGRARRGKSESMTGAKEAAVEVRKVGGMGDNSSLAMPEPQDWDHHKKSIRGWREKVATATSGLRNAIKGAKKAGVNMESLNLVVGIERQNDPAKAMQFFQQIDLGLSLSEESTLRITPHDTLAGDQEDLVAQRFYEAGKAGRTFDCRYPESSDLYSLARDSWVKGQAEVLGIPAEQVSSGLTGADTVQSTH